MKKNHLLIIVLSIVLVAVLIALVFLYLQYQTNQQIAAVSNFDQCAALGNPIMESYPEQCRTRDGRTFSRDIGNELEKLDLIRVSAPRPNQTVSSPLAIKGEARGNWFFEASFPIQLLDGNGQLLGTAIAQAKGDWMTTDFVPFEATLEFSKPVASMGKLIFKKDNPSGLPQYDDQLVMPVKF